MAQDQTNGSIDPNAESIDLYYPLKLAEKHLEDDVSYIIFSIFDRVNSSRLKGDVNFAVSIQPNGSVAAPVFGSDVTTGVDERQIDARTSKILSENEKKNGVFRVDKSVFKLNKFIILPMPNQFSSPLRASMNADSSSIASAALTGGQVDATKVARDALMGLGKKFVDQFTERSKVTSGATNDLIRAAGLVQNDRKEMFFNGVEFRRFDFSYTLSPRSAYEADRIMQIIKTFRFYMLPSYNGSQFYLIQPSEFEMKFMSGNKENNSVPRVGRCLLEAVNVNYTPKDKWVVNQTEGDVRGFPPEVFITLSFVEKQTMYREKVSNPKALDGDTFTNGGF